MTRYFSSTSTGAPTTGPRRTPTTRIFPTTPTAATHAVGTDAAPRSVGLPGTRRTGGTPRRRAGLLALLGVLLGLLAPAAVPTAAHALDPGNVVVEDTAGVLYRPQLDSALQSVTFREPTRVAVYTVRGAGSSDTALNENVLAFARRQHPEWLSADGQKWADGLFVFAVDPQDRHVGTYVGEDRKLSSGDRDTVQNATKDLFRDAQWTDGTVAGVKKAADLIGRPWYLNPALWILAAAVVVVALVAIGIALYYRGRRRQTFETALAAGRSSYTSVTRDLEVTELNASTIPEASAHGSAILQQWRGFLADYHDLTREQSDLDAMPRRQRANRAAVTRAEQFQRRGARLDGLDDAIADANAILNRGSTWESAWRRQTEELTAQLDEIDAMLDDDATAGSNETRAVLRAFGTRVRGDLTQWGGALGDGSLEPDAALDHLDGVQHELAALMERHADAVISARAKTGEEERLMRDALQASRDEAAARRSPSITRWTSADTGAWLPVWAYTAGFSSGQSAVDHARSSASSSGGGSTGYGASGGSFSGSGSSSSF